MIKNWNQFIKESHDFWISKEDIQEVFLPFTDVGYVVKIFKAFFLKMENSNGLISKDDVVSLNDDFYTGYQIFIRKSNEKVDEDLTLYFKSVIKFIESEGYKIKSYDDEDEVPQIDNLHFIKGSIITWIPEKQGKPLPSEFESGDIYVSSGSITINIYQPELIELKEENLAEIYNWSNYTTDSHGNIYCELDIEDMSDLMLSRNSSYKDSLINGGDCDNYWNSDYQPDIQHLFRYDLQKENEILAVKSLIKELGGLEEFVKECSNEELSGKTEEEVINFLLKERYYNTLEDLCKDSEIIGEIRQTIADWSCQAHCEKNQSEIEESFDRILDKEDIEYTKSLKEGKRYYYRKIPGTDRKERVYYDEMVWFYKIEFQERWISDYGKTSPNTSLSSVFSEWCYDSYFQYDLNPHFSDWGDVDDEALNKEIGAILKNYLKE